MILPLLSPSSPLSLFPLPKVDRTGEYDELFSRETLRRRCVSWLGGAGAGVYVGDWRSCTIHQLLARNITAVVTVMDEDEESTASRHAECLQHELDTVYRNNVMHRRHMVRDDVTWPDLLRVLPSIVADVDQFLLEGRNVLIQCRDESSGLATAVLTATLVTKRPLPGARQWFRSSDVTLALERHPSLAGSGGSSLKSDFLSGLDVLQTSLDKRRMQKSVLGLREYRRLMMPSAGPAGSKARIERTMKMVENINDDDAIAALTPHVFPAALVKPLAIARPSPIRSKNNEHRASRGHIGGDTLVSQPFSKFSSYSGDDSHRNRRGSGSDDSSDDSGDDSGSSDEGYGGAHRGYDSNSSSPSRNSNHAGHAGGGKGRMAMMSPAGGGLPPMSPMRSPRS